MKICFCLPEPSRKPVGGYKIVFEYANRLIENGHEVSIVFNCENALSKYNIPKAVKKIICKYLIKIHPKWFSLSKEVKKIYADGINNDSVPDGDVIIATAVRTAPEVFKLARKKGEKIYFIQDFENWNLSNEDVYETYSLNMKKIVISKWLKKIVDEKSPLPSIYIPNGIDFDSFGIDIPLDEREKHSLSMLYHKSEHKGTKYGLEAIYKLKKIYPDLKVRMFGAPKRPKDLPGWIEYTSNASKEELRMIYNRTAVFLCTSVIEGFGLTGAEAMACGCALVSTAYNGVFEYAENGKSALISPIKDADSLVKNVSILFEDDNLRKQMGFHAQKDIKKLSWERSIQLFENAIKV
ncbi:glycosyltransferase family 4 protein [Weizmannia acidilactici]|uniref:glycosyltransferase family 4 protein n=1 Tax=Weizmannia acidilactici TaxID=2607726 RepID=UPI00124DCEBD|nr:glycosyltransferase family 4 protein [Weizmannia acidilactici]GER74417.1 glycosyltransferase family 1 [Weizmannia acidilactici]